MSARSDRLPEATSAQRFATSIEQALDAARASAGDLDVNLMGSAVLTAALAAGLVDEIIVHEVPVLLGAGRRLFQELPTHLRLSLVEAVSAPGGDAPALPARTMTPTTVRVSRRT